MNDFMQGCCLILLVIRKKSLLDIMWSILLITFVWAHLLTKEKIWSEAWEVAHAAEVAGDSTTGSAQELRITTWSDPPKKLIP